MIGTPLPYEDVLAPCDRLWEISPGLMWYHGGGGVGRRRASRPEADREPDGRREGGGDTAAPADCSLTLLCTAVVRLLTHFFTPVSSATMAQCTRAFVKSENCGFGEVGKVSQAAVARMRRSQTSLQMNRHA